MSHASPMRPALAIGAAALILMAAATAMAGRAGPPGPPPPGPAAPELFLPRQLAASGKITLTPGFTPDGQRMYFSQTPCLPIWECPQALLVIDRRPDGGWGTPRPIDLGRPGRAEYPSVSPDGRHLYFSWSADRPEYAGRDISDNFDLWRLDLDRPGAAPVWLDAPDLNRVREGRVKRLRYVNNETAPVLTRSGDLYFWSERLDAIGERDIFVARGDGRGGFRAPVPLPAPINSAGREDSSWVSPDGQILLFASRDRGGCGGSDLFIARRLAGNAGWSQPRNLGCGINSAADEGAATLIPGTNRLVFMSSRAAPGLASGTVALWTAPLALPLASPP